ncbi:hypothetical protein AYI92_07380 [Shewanella xiamenensis]|uniref:hypothetical protein n=1 Tax=Shewanella xiamenensis TaxID=332186 RepID=UPI0011852BBD|nr:hypothetical protein [Shewanella xiamenensis]TVL20781.1 hypothetical protein AYI90_07760 [Shewanella xiamenensis]TVL20920.1 hypothetical protein AYI91_08585 [Shewanella xiamenensis]TVL27134.1 hypothetical protein AYI92_07380 [Shewanella xiamenensis]TVL34371.1 hypothetical protein AYI93_07995 [Shewanella xiamenensis]TVP03327.1 hypothetical protein AYI89_07985 [Shewanella xiamenensis]
MKKIVIAAAIIAAGAGAYWYTQHGSSSSASANPLLDYIPADTPVFTGQLKPFPLKNYLQSISSNYQQYSTDSLAQLGDLDSPMAKFFVSIYKQYMDGMKDPTALLKTFGLPNEIKPYFYTLGVVPVLKTDINQIDAFWAVLDKAEQESGYTHEKRTLAGIDYRAYSFAEEGSTDKADLLFAHKDGILTVTFSASSIEPEVLEMALGLKKPAQSLAASGMLQEIIKTHGFMDDSISFINHVEIVKAITSQDGNMLAKQLTKFLAEESQGEDPLAQIRTPECRTELTAIAANWPRTVGGLTAFTSTEKESHMAASFVIESKNQAILTALQKMRGFIPAHLADINSTIFSMGLGIDVNEVAPSLTAIWDDLQKPQLTCAPLAELQAELSQQSPAMLGMFTGMANGVKGLSVSLLDYKMSSQDQEPKLESLDALISLTADNPSMLFNMVKPFAPMLAELQVADNGEPTDLSPLLMLPPELNIKPMLAIKGQHLVVYAGDKGLALANKLASEKPSANGLYSMSADYGKMFTPVLTLLEMTGEPVPEELQALKDYNMRVQMSFDVNKQGLVFGSVMNSKASDKK